MLSGTSDTIMHNFPIRIAPVKRWIQPIQLNCSIFVALGQNVVLQRRKRTTTPSKAHLVARAGEEALDGDGAPGGGERGLHHAAHEGVDERRTDLPPPLHLLQDLHAHTHTHTDTHMHAHTHTHTHTRFITHLDERAAQWPSDGICRVKTRY